MDQYAAHFADEAAKLRAENERLTERLQHIKDLCEAHGLDSVTSAVAEVVRLREKIIAPNGFIMGWNEAIENAYMVAKNGAGADAIRKLKMEA